VNSWKPAKNEVNPLPEVIDYEGSDYRERFWEDQGREYEDLAERIAMGKLLPAGGRCLAELGAGFGRLADLYAGYQRVLLVDYSRSLLRQARDRWGDDPRFLYVAANLYELPLSQGVVDVAVTVRVMHHLADVPAALAQIRRAIVPGGAFVVEYASKRHLKAIARYALGRQAWSPFEPAPYEFVPLNFDFHPRWMTAMLEGAGFAIERELAVSHFRLPFLKRLLPARILAAADGAVQGIGALWKLTPSVFVRCRVPGAGGISPDGELFCCPRCQGSLSEGRESLDCSACELCWPVRDGLYDFKEPLAVSSV
jgi:SAM-dependent methyltransferase